MSARLLSIAVACTITVPCFAKVQKRPSIQLKRDFPEELTQIRVRVFPHKRNFPPHQKEKIWHKFQITSEAPCTVFDAESTSGDRAGTVVTRAKSITFDAHRLRDTVWVDCAEPYKIHRLGSGLPSFTYEAPIQIKSIVWKKKRILQAVAFLSIEDYLRGVVPSEVMAGWPMETLKSQAVAARTYAVYHMSYARKYSRHPDFDVDDTVVFQAYTGIDSEHERTNTAVAETEGEILMFGDEVIQAYYHADSGGTTASAAQVFKMAIPYCQPKKESYKNSLVRSAWTVQLTIADVNHKLSQLGFIDRTNPIATVEGEKIRKSVSGRVRGIDVTLKDGSVSHIAIEKWKRAIALNSSLFTVAMQNSERGNLVTFTGKGSGHGVGLNQTGAKVLAHNYGWSYDKILKFYYTGIKVCSIQSGIGKATDAEPCLDFSDT